MREGTSSQAYTIERSGFLGLRRRLVARERLTPEDFAAIAQALGRTPLKVQKIAPVSARQAVVREDVDTRWRGETTSNVAAPGDWIVTNLDVHGEPLRDRKGVENVYAIAADRFLTLYEAIPGTEGERKLFRSKVVAEAIHFSGGFDLAAPWGARQSAPSGYLISSEGEVYGNEEHSFRATYRVLG